MLKRKRFRQEKLVSEITWKGVFIQRQRGANRLDKAQLWRVQRPKGAGLSAGLATAPDQEDKGKDQSTVAD
jgi:hypothetical protein